MYIRLSVFVVILLLAQTAYMATTAASEEAAVTALNKVVTGDAISSCQMQENASVNISFQGMERDVQVIQRLLDEQVKRMETLAGEAGIEKFVLQSQNYNVSYQPQSNSSNNFMPEYQFYGNLNFMFFPSVKAPALIAKLAEEKVQFNVSVNSYRNAACP